MKECRIEIRIGMVYGVLPMFFLLTWMENMEDTIQRITRHCQEADTIISD